MGRTVVVQEKRNHLKIARNIFLEKRKKARGRKVSKKKPRRVDEERKPRSGRGKKVLVRTGTSRTGWNCKGENVGRGGTVVNFHSGAGPPRHRGAAEKGEGRT